MSSLTIIDLSKLPAPKVVDELDYENLLREYYQDFLAKDKSYDALLESDPAMAILQAGVYREMLVRQRINECAKANLLAYATEADLDQKATSYGVSRLEDDNINMPDKNGHIPLWAASFIDRKDIARELIKAGAKK